MNRLNSYIVCVCVLFDSIIAIQYYYYSKNNQQQQQQQQRQRDNLKKIKKYQSLK